MKVTLNKTRVADAIRRCASVANAGKMGAISGKIRVVATLDSVEFVATDGARLIRITPPDAIDRVVEPGETLVPCRELLGVLSTSVDSDLTIERETERLVVSSGTATYRLQATDAPFPQPLKRQTLKTFEVSGAELAVAAKVARSTVDCDRGRGYALAGAVRAAACVADAKRPSVWLRLADGKLTAETTGAEIGASRITQAVEYRGEPFEVEFDSRFLLGFFGVLPSATPLTYWHGGDRIALFETSDGKISFVCLPLQPPQNKEKRR